MRYILIILIPFLSINSFAQRVDTVYYNSKWQQTDKSKKHYYRTIQMDSVTNRFHVKDFYPDGKIQMEGKYMRLNPDVRNGEFKWWFENGQKQREALIKGDTTMKLVEWDINGKLISQSELVNTADIINGETVYNLKSIELAPSFPGGVANLSAYLSKNIKYPTEAVRKSLSGKVIVMFVVSTSGKITNAEIIQSVHPLLDKEALRVVNSMPKWEPGKQEGKNVNVKLSLPINFQ